MGKCEAKQGDRRGEDLWLKIVFLPACLCVIFALNYTSIIQKAFTYDEPWHLNGALGLVQGDATRTTDASMPFSALNAAAVMLLEDVPSEKRALADFSLRLRGAPLVAARLMTSFCALILATLVYLWARSLYGPFGGGLSLLLCTFSPNLLAHSRLITTDLFATLMITASLYSFWAFLNRGGWKRGVICGAALGVAQLAKSSCIFLYPLFLLLAFLRWVPEMRSRGRHFFRAGSWRKAIGYVVVFSFLTVAIIQAGFLFHGVYAPLSSYQFKRDLFRSVQNGPGAIAQLPVPLPYPYLQGLDWVVFNDSTGSSQGRIYLLGELRQGDGFFAYYLVGVLFKVPIAGLILLGWSLAHLWRERKWDDFWHNDIFLLVPLLFFFFYLSFLFDTQVGLRYLLPVFPLVFLFCGRVANGQHQLTTRRKAWLVLLVLYFSASSLSYHPHYLSYFNELLPNRKMAYRILADSNLEWGQNSEYVSRYLKAHPEAKRNPGRPTSGRIVVGANRLVGIDSTRSENEYAWLRDNFEPSEHIAYGWLVFDVSPEELKNIVERP